MQQFRKMSLRQSTATYRILIKEDTMNIDRSKIKVEPIKYGCVTIGHGNEKIILAMVNSGDYTLSEALAVYTSACERCANVLAWKYTNGEDGYPEFSKKWNEANTECDFCRAENYADMCIYSGADFDGDMPKGILKNGS